MHNKLFKEGDKVEIGFGFQKGKKATILKVLSVGYSCEVEGSENLALYYDHHLILEEEL